MKKHHNSHRTVEMKKKTRAEVTRDNRQRTHAPVNTHQPKPDLPTWDDLNGLHHACRQLLCTVQPVASIFVSKELIEALGDNVIKLRDMATTLNNDVKEYVDALNEISNNHQGKTGPITEGDELLQMLAVGEQYHAWTDSYQSVVVPTIGDIFALTNSFLPSDKQIPS